ncbi:hypothetical protein LXL04_027738 [Taraxacum kok-saghyz]
MASSSGKKKGKGPEKVYVQDSESDGDGVDIGFVDFSEETFKPTLNSCDDPFLNLLCDESMLRSGIDRMKADTGEPDLKETEQQHINVEILCVFQNFKDGWIRGCRMVIGLDGCFLKGQVKGELLTAIGRDADNHVYPIAWAVVDVENIDNWNWFLDLLVDDLDLGSENGLVVISDQHKGLLGAVSQLLPQVEL